MRSVLIIGLAVLGFAQTARAADPAEYDVPDLRGSNVYEPPAYKTYPRWNGFYVGGQVEYGSGNLDFSKATDSLVAFSLRELAVESEQHISRWEVLGRRSTGSTGFGGFVGYNTQWEDVILGVEANYSHNSFSGDAPVSPLGPRSTTGGGNTYLVNPLTGSASVNLIDYGTLKGRVGYAIGNFLPYVTAGVAVGRADFTRSSSITLTENPGAQNAVTVVFTNSEAKNNAFMAGWAIGGGVDWALWSRVFVRAEMEYIKFTPISGIAPSLTVGRLGAGLRF